MERIPTHTLSTLESLTREYESLLEKYNTTLQDFQIQGTQTLDTELKLLKAQITALEATLTEHLAPLGMSIDTPPRRREDPEAINQFLKEHGSPAILDESIGERGIVTIDIPETLKDKETAFQSFRDADGGSPSYIWKAWENGEWNPPEGHTLDIFVLSYNNDPETRESSEKIVADMDRLGFRPLTLEEMTITGVIAPQFTKNQGTTYFIGLTRYDREGDSCVPVLWRLGDERMLGGNGWDDGWFDGYRFLCART